MITITNNQGGEKNKLTVTKGAYENFYKRLGYTIIEDKKEVSVKKADTPKEIEEPKVEEEKKEEEEEVSPSKDEKNNKNKKISD